MAADAALMDAMFGSSSDEEGEPAAAAPGAAAAAVRRPEPEPEPEPLLPAGDAAAGGWSVFGDSGSDSDEGAAEGDVGDEAGGDEGSIDVLLLAQLLRACPRRAAEPSVGSVEEGASKQKLALPASVLLVGDDPRELEALAGRLAPTGAAVRQRRLSESGAQDGAKVDCVLLLLRGALLHAADAGLDSCQTGLRDMGLRCLRWLQPGGTLLLRTAGATPAALGEAFPPRLWLAPAAVGEESAAGQLHILQRVAIVANTSMTGDAIHYAAPSLARERALLEEFTLPRTVAERAHGTLSEASFRKATSALRNHGVCVLRGLFEPQAVGSLAAAATGEAVASAKQVLEGAEEGQGREAFNVNDDKFTVRSDTLGAASALQQHPLIVALLEAVALEPMPGTAEASQPAAAGQGRLEKTALRRSVALLEAQPVGGVVSLPGAARQAIHPDAEHLYEHTTLPPHYVVLFLPCCEAAASTDPETGGDHDAALGSSDLELGQTAFFAGTHLQGEAAALMASNEGSDDERERARGAKLARPHCARGDALLFDARLLHFGLPNRSAQGLARPLLYVNYHRPWFADFQPGAQIIVRHGSRAAGGPG